MSGFIANKNNEKKYRDSKLITAVKGVQKDAQELGFVLKSEQREALELLLRGKDVFCDLPTGFRKRLIY